MSRALSFAIFTLTAAGFAGSGCGARTGDDELLGFSDGPIAVGGFAGTTGGSGGVVTGGTGGVVTGGSGAFPGGGTGGFVVCEQPLCDCNDCFNSCLCSGRFGTPEDCEFFCSGGIGGSPAGGTGGVIAGGAGGVITGGTGGVITGGTGGVDPRGPCCEPSTVPGCFEPAVQDCVCASDPFCCGGAWDGLCVKEVDALGCGMCGAGGTGGTGGVSTGGAGGMPTGGTGGVATGGVGGMNGACCDAHLGLGCDDPDVASCVCGVDPFCCNVGWDALCTREVNSLGCGMCGAGGTGGTGGVAGSGGVVGTGGTGGSGGSAQCALAFQDACGQCLCNNCLPQLQQCLGDFGCLAIISCIEETGCEGGACYSPMNCKGVIDTFGGINGQSLKTVTNLFACGTLDGCPCE